MLSGIFQVSVNTSNTSNEWVHGVLNFLGPNDGEGIRIYENGKHVGNDTTVNLFKSPRNESNGQIVIGRLYAEHLLEASVQVDELMFFNKSLTEAEIALLSRDSCF